MKDLQMKKALRSVMIVLLLCVAAMTKVYAVTIGDLNYTLNSNTLTATVTGHKDGTAATGNLIIPSSVTYGGQTYSVTSIGNYAFRNCSGLTGSLTISNSVTSINYGAFQGCSGFTGSLTISNSVTSIGTSAFQSCSGFTSLTIGNSMTMIGDYAFYNCSGFTGSLTIPDSVTTIDNCAFYNCSGFTGSLTIPNSVTTIGSSAFSNCSGFTGLTIGNSVATIGNGAFYGCSGFTGSLTIPDSVTTIGSNAFYYCTGFTGSLTIGNSVTTIGNYAFFNCSGFTGSLTIGNSVTSIGNYAFFNCSGFTGSLTIGNSVTTIGNWVFQRCTGFKGNLTIGNSVTDIGQGAFSGGIHFSSITSLAEIPPSIDGEAALSSYLGSSIVVYVPCGFEDAYTSISWGGFSNFVGLCGGIVTVATDPEECGIVTGGGQFEAGQACTVTATANEGYTFVNWTNNGAIVSFEAEYIFYVAGEMTMVAHFVPEGNIVFADSNVKSICVAHWDTNNDGELSYLEAASVTRLENYFQSNSQITSFEELQYFIGLSSINGWAFDGCSGLTGDLNIPNSVTSIGPAAFQSCSGLTGSLTIPNSVTTIGSNAFFYCSGLTGSLTIPNSVTTIGGQAFSGCSGFTGNLTIPNSVTTIEGSCAFQGCGFTGALIIPNSITTIGSCTFNMCWNFTSVEIPETVTFIGERAFACWYGLQSMTVLAANPPVLDNNAFVNVNKSIPVYVPVGSIPAYQSASGWSEFTNYHEYVPTSYTITASANPADGGSVTGGGTYTQGTTCTLTATANEGYSFVNWTENGNAVSTNANYSFTVSEDRNLVAHFDSDGNHWTPNGSSYSEIMAMYSVIQIDGVEQYSNTLEVGVFCGDECRGSAIASEFYLTHRYLAILDVFGENGHQLTFKLYDHSIGQELNLTSPATITFDVNGYGNPIEPYVLNFTSTVTHTQPLASGWNWWSTYIEQNGIDGLGMLENSIGTAGVRIQGRNGTIDQFEYQGTSYWYGSLNAIANEQMYKIRTNAACNAVIVGNEALPANHPITINNGWNWIGFPCGQSLSVNVAMSGFTPETNDVIKGRNGSTTYVSYGSTSLWYGTLNTLEPGQGYMYKSNSSSSKTLTFQTGRGEGTVVKATNENSFFTPDVADFSDNMLVTAVIEMEGQELRSEDYELAAYVGNECRGSVRLMYVEPFDRYVAFLLIFGEAEEDIHFVLTDGNDMTWSDDLLTYAADGMEGTLTEPATLHFGALGLNEGEHDFVNVFPNPSNGVYNIEGNGLRKIEVVNAFGQTILSKDVEDNLVQIDLADKATGVYLLRVITNNGITTKQLIKE